MQSTQVLYQLHILCVQQAILLVDPCSSHGLICDDDYLWHTHELCRGRKPLPELRNPTPTPGAHWYYRYSFMDKTHQTSLDPDIPVQVHGQHSMTHSRPGHSVYHWWGGEWCPSLSWHKYSEKGRWVNHSRWRFTAMQPIQMNISSFPETTP